MTRRTAGAGNDALSPDFLDFIVCLNEQRAHAVTFAEVWKGASMATVDGQDVRIIGLREMEKNKLATGRTKDKEDVRRLRTMRSRKNR